MKISVVTVTYNSAASLEETILSVLNQTYPNIEYIIIDGGSTDGTVDIIKKYADRLAYWVSEPDKGIYDAMNKGIAVATGDYINFMNSGDKFSTNDSLSSFIPQIRTGTNIVYGNWLVKYKEKNYEKKPLTLDYLKSKLPFCHQSTLISTKFHKIHPYSIKLKIASDYKFVYDSYFKVRTSFQYIPVCLAVFDSTDGVSSFNFFTSTNEKFAIWGIEKNFCKKIPWYFAALRMYISYAIRRIIPGSVTVMIRKTLDSRRKHQ